MSVNDLYFVDTNILVYARDSSEKTKQPKALEWLSWLWENRNGRLSSQVLNEYYVTVTQKLKPGMKQEEAWQDVENLMTWQPLSQSSSTLNTARIVQQKTNYSWWDCLIIASARIAGCAYLLSEDLQGNSHVGDVTIINPFESDPQA